MKLIIDRYGKHAVYASSTVLVAPLELIPLVDEVDLEALADFKDYNEFRAEVKAILADSGYGSANAIKLSELLGDGIFTYKRNKTFTLSRRGQSYAGRLRRMTQNLERAEVLGIEAHLLNKILKENKNENATEILGL